MNILLKNGKYSYHQSEDQILGKGSFGIVYRGKDLSTNEDVAIKLIKKSDIEEDEYMKTALKKELEIQKLCSCQYSTNLIDNFEENKNIYIILELCDNDLEKELKEHGPYSVDQIRNMLVQLNQVFLIMNKNKIIHRDLKLANILIKYTNNNKNEFDVKLADFGISTIVQNDLASTSVGTPLMSAPEILNGEEYTNKVDIWSLGIIIYQLYFNKLPFLAKNIKALLCVIYNKGLTDKPNDPQLGDLIYKMLRPDYEERISWVEYFKHPFFGEKIIDEISNENDDNKMWTSVYEVAQNTLKDKIKKSKFIFTEFNEFHSFHNDNVWFCFTKDKKSKKKYILKQYHNKFIDKCKDEYDNEKQLFQKFNKENISSLIYVDEMITDDTYNLIFEYTNITMLMDYMQNKLISEQNIHEIISSCIKDIFIPMSQCNINLNIITIESIAIDTDTKKAIVFDCGIIKQLYEDEAHINKYFMYPEERNIINEKTNVLNFGITMYKAIYNTYPNLSDNLKEINNSEKLKKFIQLTLCPNPNERGDWKTLLNTSYITQKEFLLSIQMIEHISNSYNYQYEVINNFIESNLFKQLPQYAEHFTCLFIYFIFLNVFYAIRLFNEIIECSNTIYYSINLIQINKTNYDIVHECLDFRKISLKEQYYDEGVIDKIKELILILEKLQKHFYCLFDKVNENFVNNFLDNSMEEMLLLLINQFQEENMIKYIDNVRDLIMKNNDSKNNFSLFLKYLYEYVITLYEITLGQPKVVEENAYDINELFGKYKSNDDLIKGTIFMCFLMNVYLNYFEKQCIMDCLPNKEILKSNHERFVKEYCDVLKYIDK